MEPNDENETDPDSESEIKNESLFQQIRALPRVVWILCIGVFINRFGTFVIPFLTLYLGDKGYSAGQIAWIFASYGVGAIAALFLGGRLADLIGRKNTMSIGLIGGGLSMLLLWQADSFPMYLTTIFIVGLTHSMYHPAANSLLIDVVPTDRRVTTFAVVRWAVNLGFACGMAVGGLLAEANYDWLFIGDAVTSTIYGLIAAFTLPHGIRTSAKKSRWRPAIQHMFSNRAFVIFFIANLLAVSTFFQWGSSVARFLQDMEYSKAVYGWLMAMNGLLITFFEIPISQLGRRFKPRYFIALGFFLCGFGVFLNAFAAGWIVVGIALIVFTVGEMIAMPVSGAYLAEMAPEKMRGRYSAAIGLTWSLNHSVAPGLGLMLYIHQPDLLWMGMLLVGCVSAALLLFQGQKMVGEEPA